MDVESTSSATTPIADVPERPRIRRQRKRAPKSRFGCKTCKTRRVKCDESRPVCMRCIGYGVQCEGYIIIGAGEARGLPRSLAPATNSENSSHVILSRARQAIPSLTGSQYTRISGVISRSRNLSASSSGVTQRIESARDRTNLRDPLTLSFTSIQNSKKFDQNAGFWNQPGMSPPPSAKLFSSSQEQQYFDYYQNVTVNQVSGWYLGSVWNCLILQAAHRQEGFVRNCLVAIGAVSKSHECRKLETSNQSELSAQHLNVAFSQYGKAVRQIRNSISQASDIRTVLISCLLLVCFEDVLGGSSRREAICTQIGYAVKLFFDWAKKQRLKGIPHPQEGLCSPNPAVIEDDLYQAFLLLDFKCMYDQDTRSFTIHMQLACFGNETILNMPSLFDSAKHAELYYSLIIRRAMHYLTAVRQVGQNKIPLFMSILEAHVDLPENIAMEHRRRLMTIVAAGFKKYLTELHRWHAAFQPVLKAASRDRRSKSFIHAMVLESYIKSAILRFAGPKAEQQILVFPLDQMDRETHHQLPVDSMDTHRSEKVFFTPCDIPSSTQLGVLDEERTANRGIEPTKANTSQRNQAEKDLPPVHMYKGVKYGYLNPLEGFGWQRGLAAAWYEERWRNSSDSKTDLVILYERRDATGRVEIEIVNCSQPGDLGTVPPVSQVRTAPPLLRL